MTEYVHACETGADNSTLGAELWYLSSGTYGRQADTGFAKKPADGTGDDGRLKHRTLPFAPIGRTGQLMLRRVYVIIGHQFGESRIRVTPILDFGIRLTSRTFALPPPSTAKQLRSELEMPVARKCTWVEVEIEVLQRLGRVDVMGVDVGFRPVSQAASSVVGVEV